MVMLTTERLIIRDPDWADFDGWHKLLSDERTMYHLDDIMTRSEDESRQNLAEAIGEVRNPGRTKYFFVVETKADKAFMGNVGYTVTDITPKGKIAHLGYFILPEFHGKGYMTEAVKELLRFAFEEDDVYRIETECYAENIASERVMQKCGLIREGCKVQCAWHDGQLKDRILYRLLKNELVEPML